MKPGDAFAYSVRQSSRDKVQRVDAALVSTRARIHPERQHRAPENDVVFNRPLGQIGVNDESLSGRTTIPQDAQPSEFKQRLQVSWFIRVTIRLKGGATAVRDFALLVVPD